MTKSTTSSIAAALVVVATPLAVAATSHGGAMMTRSGSSTPGVNKTEAMNEIRTDGYTNVKELRKATGVWTASAMEGGKPVSLRIDTLGNVRKEQRQGGRELARLGAARATPRRAGAR